jgi:hypothetical protein
MVNSYQSTWHYIPEDSHLQPSTKLQIPMPKPIPVPLKAISLLKEWQRDEKKVQ